MKELHVYFQNKKAFQFTLNQPQVIVGRSAESDLILSGETVSRRHAIISQSGQNYNIEDFSSHGTLLNGEALQNKKALFEGDVVRICDWELKVLNVSEEKQTNEITKRAQQIEITKHLPNQPSAEILEFQNNATELRSTFPILIVQQPGGKSARVLMKKKVLILGSAADCDLVLEDEFVSAHHARLSATDRGFLVEDLDSTNGTWIDKARVLQICITDSQKMQLGKTEILISLKYETPEKIKPIEGNEYCGMIGTCESMRMLFAKIQKVAATDMTTLILGETGTGKELVAKAIHDLSPRRTQPYVIINCGAISPQLIESELFGHEKGAFTGAERQHKGVFEQAHQGTLFLDEVGELPLDLQAKVLRVLEYKTLRRVGGDVEIKVDVRVVAATHRNLPGLVSTRKFREDLFYRLYVLPLQIPSLRERANDVVALTQHFVATLASSPIRLTSAALQKLAAHTWPGNVRELKNTILRAMAFCDSTTLDDKNIEFLKFDVEKPAPQKMVSENDAEERQQVLDALQQTNGDKEKAAEIMGVSRATFFRKTKKFGL